MQVYNILQVRNIMINTGRHHARSLLRRGRPAKFRGVPEPTNTADRNFSFH